MILLSNALLVVFWILILSGVYGMFKFKTTWCKTLNSSKMDSVAVIVLMVALMLRTGWSTLTPKLFLLLLFYLLTNPIANQLIVYSAKKEAESGVNRQ